MTKRVVIIGGGIIGLSSAWYCRSRGHDVTVIDRGDAKSDGCSYGNAGMIVPSHFVPLAAPGMIKLGLKWMASSESPFAIEPRLSWDLLSWLWKFQAACSPSHVARSAPLLRDMHLASRAEFDALSDEWSGCFGLVTRGLMMLCRSETALHEEAETARMARHLGIPAEVLSAGDAQSLDPSITMDVRGGVYFPKDCHLSPSRLMVELQNRLLAKSVDFRWNTNWQSFVRSGQRVERVVTSDGDIACDEVIICGGVWSPGIGKALGISLPIQAGKGYSVTLSEPRQLPEICSILTEARVAVTPMGNTLRFGGTMEISGTRKNVSESRVRGILKSIPSYFPEFKTSDFSACKPWVGLRPCSPDGLPYIGRTKRSENVIVSTGHAMMGVSLAMASAKVLSKIVDGEPAGIEGIELMSPDRYG